MDIHFSQFLFFLPVFCFPFVFLAVALPIMLGIAWLAGRVNRKTITITIDYEEDRVVNEGTINVMTGDSDGSNIMIHNSPSIYGWKWFKKTTYINKGLVPGKTYELIVAGFSWPFGQNVIEIIREV